MATIFDRFTTSLKQRARYRRTLAALRDLSPNVARDLEIFPGDAESIARNAVYGA